MRCSLRSFAFCLLLSLTAITSAFAADRPTIGLALGGGGARGLAHIGVLEWLDEHHIPIDYIAGTSSGGLVGGFYAMGMPPTEIEQLTHSVDWNAVFSLDVPYELKDFRRKEDELDYPGGMEFGWRHNSLTVRSGLFAAMPVDLLLDRITLPYDQLSSFNQLPIPFRCVAVDMDSGTQVVLRSGSLAQALRATMAIPGVFTPVKLNGMTLADGGILNNVPADVVKAMGADVVIAVNVSTLDRGHGYTASPLGMVQRTVSILINDNTQQALKQANLVIPPDLQGVSIMDWTESDSIAAQGYAAAEAQSAQLLRYRVDDATWAAYLAQRQARERTAIPIPRDIIIEGASPENAQVIREQLRSYIGKPLDTAALEHDLTAMTGSERYDSLSYQIRMHGTVPVLVILVEQKTYAPPFLRLAIRASGSTSEPATANAGARLTALDVGGYGSEVRTDVGVGEHFLVRSEYYHRLKNSRVFLAPSAGYSWETQELYDDGTHLAEYGVKQFSIGADMGYAINRDSEVRLGYAVNQLQVDPRIGSPDIVPEYEGTEQDFRGRWMYDDTDDAAIPTKGLYSRADLHWYTQSPGVSSSYVMAAGKAMSFLPLTQSLTLFTNLEGGTNSIVDLPFYRQFTLGGPFRLGAYERDQFRGPRYLLGSIGTLRRVSKSPNTLAGNSYVMLSVDAGSTFEHFDEAEYEGEVTFGLVIKTLLGPLFLAGSLGESDYHELYFSLGNSLKW